MVFLKIKKSHACSINLMASNRLTKVRQVNTFFWDDPYIQELYHFGKLLFLYLITSPHTNIAGSFEITEKQMHEHTGIPRTEIVDLLKRFEEDGKIVYRNNWMLTVNTIEHQNTNNSRILEGIKVIVRMSPTWVMDELCMTHAHLNLNSNLNPNSNSNGGTPPVAAVAAVDTSPMDKAQQSDPVERRIWNDGKELLKRSGMSDQHAGSLLGRWAKEAGRERLAEVIAITLAVNASDPKSYIGGVLKQRATPDRDADCAKCGNERRVRGNLETWPCPKCRPVEYARWEKSR